MADGVANIEKDKNKQIKKKKSVNKINKTSKDDENNDVNNVNNDEKEGKKDVAEAMTQETGKNNGCGEENKCGQCEKEPRKKDRNGFIGWIECDVCEKWICGECHQIETRFKGCMEKRGVKWICVKCEEHFFLFKMEGGRDRNKTVESNWGRMKQKRTMYSQ